MKKGFIIIIIIFIVIMSALAIMLKDVEQSEKALKRDNYKYEQYVGTKIYGTDVTTVINRAIDNNEKYKIPKDEKGMYINDNKYCIKVELNMITEKDTFHFQMEQLYSAGMTEFVRLFNILIFECTSIEYHEQTGRVSKIVFTQLEE